VFENKDTKRDTRRNRKLQVQYDSPSARYFILDMAKRTQTFAKRPTLKRAKNKEAQYTFERNSLIRASDSTTYTYQRNFLMTYLEKTIKDPPID